MRMIGRLLTTLLQEDAAPGERSARPNALSRESVRAERIRRESGREVAGAERAGRAAEEHRPSRPAPPPETVPGRRPGGHPTLVAALRSRAGVRRAWLTAEILGPPQSLRRDEETRFDR